LLPFALPGNHKELTKNMKSGIEDALSSFFKGTAEKAKKDMNAEQDKDLE
jgi:hypothetical protein